MFKEKNVAKCIQVNIMGTWTKWAYKNKHLEQHTPRRTTIPKIDSEYFRFIKIFSSRNVELQPWYGQ